VLADDVLSEAGAAAEAVLAEAAGRLNLTADLASQDFKLLLPDGRAVGGTVSGLNGDVLQSVGYSRLGPKHRLAAWVRVLVLTAAHPERPFEAITIGRRRGDANWRLTVSLARIPPLGSTEEERRTVAFHNLLELIDLFDRGMREPPPLACGASAAFAAAKLAGRNGATAAGKVWESGWNWDREDKDLEHQLLLGGVLTMDDILAAPPRPDEDGEGWSSGDTTRFGRWALRLWTGLLGVEELTDR
jgi:exodeoxyribonuclease V gamma subunit